MNDPKMGPMIRMVAHQAAGVAPPALATRRSAASANPTIGRVAARAMITNTKSGSV
jgi:hypothetical protein